METEETIAETVETENDTESEETENRRITCQKITMTI